MATGCMRCSLEDSNPQRLHATWSSSPRFRITIHDQTVADRESRYPQPMPLWMKVSTIVIVTLAVAATIAVVSMPLFLDFSA